jgi:hypothetical protein
MVGWEIIILLVVRESSRYPTRACKKRIEDRGWRGEREEEEEERGGLGEDMDCAISCHL